MFKIDVNDYLEKSAMRKARFGGYEPDDVRRAMRELCAAYEQALADAEKQQQESRAESDALRRRRTAAWTAYSRSRRRGRPGRPRRDWGGG